MFVEFILKNSPASRVLVICTTQKVTVAAIQMATPSRHPDTIGRIFFQAVDSEDCCSSNIQNKVNTKTQKY